ncbi:RDD family protein, partial [Neptuniibacter pectenicola]|uniref:RDD family protein n=1 Tax=Neptuniibacter pectenicola TaxID=1806669 RepID=UPI0030ECA666
MEFLPIEIKNEKVYAGFGKRFGSAIVDMLVFIPFMFVFHFIESSSLSMAMVGTVLSSILFSAYSVYFHYKFGATLGKMALGIKVTLPNGEKIGFKQAILRSSVDLAFALFMVIAQVMAISNADPEVYLNAGWMERAEYIMPLFPAWYGAVNIASELWYWGEFIVLLFNKRKRALHDFIAGTVVIRQEYAESGSRGSLTLSPHNTLHA